jgi:hypothetical protein
MSNSGYLKLINRGMFLVKERQCYLTDALFLTYIQAF